MLDLQRNLKQKSNITNEIDIIQQNLDLITYTTSSILEDEKITDNLDLVEEMSERVQFIYISHNKISMEKSKHLMGVTMQEPGVSRMVAVDVDQAVELAAS